MEDVKIIISIKDGKIKAFSSFPAGTFISIHDHDLPHQNNDEILNRMSKGENSLDEIDIATYQTKLNDYHLTLKHK